MDFLDPREKKLRNIRLMIGYVLMTVLIFTATLVLVFQAYGFGVDRKTGEVIQNGLVYIDSAPDKADIYIDGVKQQDRSNIRLALKAGVYQLSIKRDGYRDWSRKIEVAGGSIERVTYPMLIQTNLAEEEIINFGVSEQLIRTQSPDRRWIMISKNTTFKDFIELDLKDADKRSDVPLSRQVSFPPEIFTASEDPHTYEIIDWSNDNEHFLVKHVFGPASEYVILNRDRPETSFNINMLIEKEPINLMLRDKKFDHWYYQEKLTGDLFFATAKKEITATTSAVTAYKSHDDTTLLYSQKAGDGLQNVYLKQGKDTKLLRSVKDGEVMLNIARFNDHWYVVVASDGDKKTYVYKDPWDFLSKNTTDRPAPQAIFHSKEAISTLEFSTNSRFIFARDGQHFAVYDAELDKMHNDTVVKVIDPKTKVEWMDGHRLIFRSEGQSFIVEFDGSNTQQLVPALSGESTFFNRDYTVLYSFQNSKKITGSIALVLTDLRYEQDK